MQGNEWTVGRVQFEHIIFTVDYGGAYLEQHWPKHRNSKEATWRDIYSLGQEFHTCHPSRINYCKPEPLLTVSRNSLNF